MGFELFSNDLCIKDNIALHGLKQRGVTDTCLFFFFDLTRNVASSSYFLRYLVPFQHFRSSDNKATQMHKSWGRGLKKEYAWLNFTLLRKSLSGGASKPGNSNER